VKPHRLPVDREPCAFAQRELPERPTVPKKEVRLHLRSHGQTERTPQVSPIADQPIEAVTPSAVLDHRAAERVDLSVESGITRFIDVSEGTRPGILPRRRGTISPNASRESERDVVRISRPL
jgi:hypothetical protein